MKITKSDENLLNFGALRYRKNEPMNIKINLKKIKSIGWKPIYNIKESLKKTISYYK